MKTRHIFILLGLIFILIGMSLYSASRNIENFGPLGDIELVAEKPPPPPSDDDILKQLNLLSSILDDATISTNLTRLSTISSQVGNINRSGNNRTDNAILKNGITCATRSKNDEWNHVADKLGCDHKTGNQIVDSVMVLEAKTEKDATNLVNNLRIVCAQAISTLLASKAMDAKVGEMVARIPTYPTLDSVA
jgi:hypothetical protein